MMMPTTRLKRGFLATLAPLFMAASAHAEEAKMDAPATWEQHADYKLIRGADIEAALTALKAKPLGAKKFNAQDLLLDTKALPIRVTLGHAPGENAQPLYEIHEAADHLFIVLEGAEEVMIGGRLINPEKRRDGMYLSQEAEGAEKVTVNKGDMLFIPRYVPHKGVSASTSTMLVVTFGDH